MIKDPIQLVPNMDLADHKEVKQNLNSELVLDHMTLNLRLMNMKKGQQWEKGLTKRGIIF